MLRPQVTVPTTSMVTLRNPAPGHVMLGQQRVQLKELQPGKDVNIITLLLHQSVCLTHVVLLVLKSLDCDGFFSPTVPVRPEVLPVSKQVGAAASGPAPKNKLKDASGMFK